VSFWWERTRRWGVGTPNQAAAGETGGEARAKAIIPIAFVSVAPRNFYKRKTF
jgi:hypothetical protein